MAKSVDDKMIGRKFGRLTVVSRNESKRLNGYTRKMWNCVCECGNHKIVSTRDLTCGNVKSCGCLAKEWKSNPKLNPETRKEHIALRRIWKGIKARCYNPQSPEYNRYGGRGIAMCNEWFSKSKAFIEWGLANDYQLGLSIDRIDNNGNYEPNNCQFLTRSENTLKDKHRLMIAGLSLRYAELSNIVGYADSYFNNRILRVGFNKAYIRMFHKLVFNVA